MIVANQKVIEALLANTPAPSGSEERYEHFRRLRDVGGVDLKQCLKRVDVRLVCVSQDLLSVRKQIAALRLAPPAPTPEEERSKWLQRMLQSESGVGFVSGTHTELRTKDARDRGELFILDRGDSVHEFHKGCQEL